MAVLSSGCRNCLQKVYNLTISKLNKNVFQHFKNLIKDKLSHKIPLTRVERLGLHGYNPKHLFGKWHLVRHLSINRARFSFYTLYKIDSTY